MEGRGEGNGERRDKGEEEKNREESKESVLSSSAIGTLNLSLQSQYYLYFVCVRAQLL